MRRKKNQSCENIEEKQEENESQLLFRVGNIVNYRKEIIMELCSYTT